MKRQGPAGIYLDGITLELLQKTGTVSYIPGNATEITLGVGLLCVVWGETQQEFGLNRTGTTVSCEREGGRTSLRAWKGRHLGVRLQGSRKGTRKKPQGRVASKSQTLASILEVQKERVRPLTTILLLVK